MCLPVNLLQTLYGRMGIHLRRRETGMAQQLLHSNQVCPGVHQVSGEAMPERVGRHSGILADLIKELADDHLDLPRREPLPPLTDERCTAVPTCNGANQLFPPGLIPSEGA